MPRQQRIAYADTWAHSADFNEHLYLALRQSPWWMISIAVHLILFVVAGLLYEEKTWSESTVVTMIDASPTPFDEEDLEDVSTPTEPVHSTDVPAPEPMLTDAPLSDRNEMDVDLPYDETLGDDGLSDGSFMGPGTNDVIGLGGNAGGGLRGRGGDEDARQGGGGANTQRAVEDALKWLVAHQSPNGAWEAAGFHRWCDGRPVAQGPDGGGQARYDVGVTGLALCAFLGGGYTNRGRHPFARTISRGLRYLKSVQDAEGCFGPRAGPHYIYNHATAALAMVEAYGMTGSQVFKSSAQKALDFLAIARNPYFAWRYGVKPGDNDTSVTGWMMMALKSAKLINEDAVRRGRRVPLVIDEEAFDGIRAWVDKMTDPDYGRTGYIERGGCPARPQALLDTFPGEKSESMTGVGVLARIFIGEDPRSSPIIKKGAELMAGCPPIWNEADGSIDMYYWYYATLAMYQVGGTPWRVWNEHLKTAVVDHQRRDTTYCLYKGSWDPVGPWGPDGGRVYSTALLAMCMEVYYRYDSVFGTQPTKYSSSRRR